jgi:hypothetical protein
LSLKKSAYSQIYLCDFLFIAHRQKTLYTTFSLFLTLAIQI